LLTYLTLHPPALADTPGQQLAAAKAAVVAHEQAAGFARQRARADAEQAALVGEQEVAAAAGLRRLEDETGGAAEELGRLEVEAGAARADLARNEVALTALLPVMQRLSAAPAATMLAVPESPNDSVRGILVLQSVAGVIEERSEAVRAEAARVAGLVGQMTAEQKVLVAAVAAQRGAEAALTAQIEAARAAEAADTDTAMAEAAAAVRANVKVQDLRGMIANLQSGDGSASQAGEGAVPTGPGAPVSGMLVENFGDPTIAGPAQGVTYQAAPGARVVAPCGGPVLFADHFRSYGLLVIVGCGGDVDFALSGMSRLDVSSGQLVARGQPVGEMQDFDAKNPTTQPHLYVELLQNGAPADPTSWLSSGGSG
jgi:septal ring factor EnvC (AmiA/AmiB activator)